MDEDLDLFLEEATDLLSDIENNLMFAEKGTVKWEEPIKVAFGAIHTIKGNSLYLNLKALSMCCQKVESILANEDRTSRLPNQSEFDILLEFVDLVRDYFVIIQEEQSLIGSDKKLISWLNKGSNL